MHVMIRKYSSRKKKNIYIYTVANLQNIVQSISYLDSEWVLWTRGNRLIPSHGEHSVLVESYATQITLSSAKFSDNQSGKT